jgi:3-keto-5-aminohexanoate cleavage enzyme
VTEQCAYHPRVRPEIAALNMGTMNYSKYSAKRKAFDFDMVFSNTYEKIGKLLKAMNEAGVKPELECFDTGHTHGHLAAARHGPAEAPPLQFSFIVGVLGGIPQHTSSRSSSRRRSCRPGSEWEVIAISHGHWRMLAAALVLGGNIRTGLEDHLYLPSGEMASSNGALVEVAVAHGSRHRPRPATVDEARAILRLGARLVRERALPCASRSR